MPKVSVIVPVYKVEQYVGRCLDSLIAQTLKEIEIIVVNDGSPDNSQDIIDKYVKKDKRIKSIVKENGGQSEARNKALDIATGEYYMFVDSDDYIALNCLEKLYNKAKSNDFDIVVCDMEYLYEKNTKIVKSNIAFDILDIDGVKHTMINVYAALCNKLYRGTLFDNERLKKGVWYEDVELLYRLLPQTRRIGTIHEALYKYEQCNVSSVTSTFNKHVYDYIDNMNGLVEYYKKNNLYDEFYPELEYFYVRYVYATFIKTAAKFDKKEYNNAVEEAIKNVTSTFPNYKKNKYLKKSKKGFYLKHFNKGIAKLVYLAKHK